MRHRSHTGLVFFGGALLLAGGLIASCMPDTTAPTLQSRPVSTSEVVSPVGVAGVSMTTPVLEPFTDQACLDCHTDQETLMQLAVEEEAPEALSSGPG